MPWVKVTAIIVAAVVVGAVIVKSLVTGKPRPAVIGVTALVVCSALVAFFLLVGKAEIQRECSMNGFGMGHCRFTNTGDGAGSVCGHVHVAMKIDKTISVQSGIFCSGNVDPSSTKTTSFLVPAIRELCRNDKFSKSWTSECTLTFVNKP